MIKGFLMASGLITLYILYGKNTDSVKTNNRMIGYSLLNMIWLLTLMGSIIGGSEPVLQIVCIVFAVAYPAIIIMCGIRNRKAVELAEEEQSCFEDIKANVPESIHKICEFYRGKPLELEPYLQTLVKKKTIDKTTYKILFDEYSKEE